jgi:catechol 2,3-dioxygenase-like lactoylglutathione lyase family enzyme
MAITGVHALLYTSEPDAVRAIFRDVFGWSHVDDGGGWLIFALPPAELAFHPADRDAGHEIFLISDDIDRVYRDLSGRHVPCAPIAEEPWGRVTRVTLPGGGHLRIYQPRHPRPAT